MADTARGPWSGSLPSLRHDSLDMSLPLMSHWLIRHEWATCSYLTSRRLRNVRGHMEPSPLVTACSLGGTVHPDVPPAPGWDMGKLPKLGNHIIAFFESWISNGVSQSPETEDNLFHLGYTSHPSNPLDIFHGNYDRYWRIINTVVVTEPIDIDEVCRMKKE